MAEDTSIRALISKLLDSYPLVLVITGAVLIVLGAAGGITYNNWLPLRDDPGRILAAIAGFFLVALSIYFASSSSRSPLDISKYNIKITHPSDGDVVDQTINLKGTIELESPSGYSIEILRTYADGGFIPMREVFEIKLKVNSWEANGCHLGGKAGDTRYIGAYLVGPNGKILINSYFHMTRHFYKELYEEKKTFPTIPSMTTDMILCDQIRVHLKAGVV